MLGAGRCMACSTSSGIIDGPGRALCIRPLEKFIVISPIWFAHVTYKQKLQLFAIKKSCWFDSDVILISEKDEQIV